jgi:hypothetical protein
VAADDPPVARNVRHQSVEFRFAHRVEQHILTGVWLQVRESSRLDLSWGLVRSLAARRLFLARTGRSPRRKQSRPRRPGVAQQRLIRPALLYPLSSKICLQRAFFDRNGHFYEKHAFCINSSAPSAQGGDQVPFKSQAQRRYMFAQHPDIAAEFAAATPKGTKLPERVSGKKTKSEKQASGAGWDPAQAILKTLPGQARQAPSPSVPQQPAMKDIARPQQAQTGLGVRAGTPLLGSAPVSPALTPAPTAPSMPTQAPWALASGAPTSAFVLKTASARPHDAIPAFERSWTR